MTSCLQKAALKRRSRYGFEKKIPISDKELQNILEQALLNTPSAFNSQSTRAVLLLGKHHKRLWEITKDILLKKIGQERFEKTREKIDESFLSGYGTILFFEDQDTVRHLQENFKSYKDKFPQWSQHTSGMHQYVVWTALAEAGIGASLQHYNPLIDQAVIDQWDINPSWTLISQMPFGIATDTPDEKTFEPLEKRLKVFQ